MIGRDKPLSFHWRALDDEWLQRFDPPPARTRAFAQSRASILLEAYLVGCGEPGRAISYSRRKQHYARQKRYHGTPYTHRNVVGAVDELAKVGLINSDKAQPGQLGWQSRFIATEKLVEAIDEPLTIVFDPHELVRLKDENGRLTDYRDTVRSHRMRNHVARINEALGATCIDLNAPDSIHEGNIIRCGDHALYVSMQFLWRVFNRNTFAMGGRFYGGWWQSARKVERAFITIDGELSVELDYPSLHPCLLYAERDLSLGGDAYDIDGWERWLVKRAFNIMLNARNDWQARAAIAQKIGGRGCYEAATSLMHAIERKHPMIAEAFCSDAGLRLQRRDADIAEDVLLSLLEKGVVALSIHDSFIVRKTDKQLLLEAMAEALEKHALVRGKSIKSLTYTNMVPHMEGEEEGAEGRPSIQVVLPSGGNTIDTTKFGRNGVPYRAVVGWCGGDIPDIVQSAIYHELTRRKPSENDLAQRIGISRPMLMNILEVHIEAGGDVARALREFIFESAETVGLVVG